MGDDMALNNTVTGLGIVVSSGKTRELRAIERLDPDGIVVGVQFRITEEERVTREWVALTREAAQAVVDAAPQPVFGVYSYSMTEDTRQVGAYKLTREYVAETEGPLTDLDECDPPTFDPNGDEFEPGEYPLSVTVESATEGAIIRYAIWHDGVLSSWATVANGGTIFIGNPGEGLDRIIYAFATRAGRQPSEIAESAPYTLEPEE